MHPGPAATHSDDALPRRYAGRRCTGHDLPFGDDLWRTELAMFVLSRNCGAGCAPRASSRRSGPRASWSIAGGCSSVCSRSPRCAVRGHAAGGLLRHQRQRPAAGEHVAQFSRRQRTCRGDDVLLLRSGNARAFPRAQNAVRLRTDRVDPRHRRGVHSCRSHTTAISCLYFFMWQKYHYQKQNYGILAFLRRRRTGFRCRSWNDWRWNSPPPRACWPSSGSTA